MLSHPIDDHTKITTISPNTSTQQNKAKQIPANQIINNTNGTTMTQTLDAGAANHSPSTEFMTLCDVDHQNDFEKVVDFLKTNLDAVIKEIHGFDKLLIDNGKTQINAPPDGASNGGLLLRTLSEVNSSAGGGITLKREFKVHDLGDGKVEIREDIVKAPATEGEPPIEEENKIVVEITRST